MGLFDGARGISGPADGSTASLAKATGWPVILVVDAAAQAAVREGRRVPLTSQEYAVLEQLVAGRGSIVSRQAIEAALHPEGGERVSNLVDVLILRLRKKLGRDLITTRRGQGFIIDS